MPAPTRRSFFCNGVAKIQNLNSPIHGRIDLLAETCQATGDTLTLRMHDRMDRTTPPLVAAAWLAVALLVPVALLNYLDRQMLAAMKSSMTADIRDVATKAHWGIVLGSFKWVYAFLSPIGGYLADRFPRRHVICISLLVWSA